MGITIEKLWVHKLIVLFLTNQPHFLQKIISSLDDPKHAMWMDFFTKQIIHQMRQSIHSFDICLHVTNSNRFIFQKDPFIDSLSTIQKEYKIPIMNPFAKRWGFIKNSFELKNNIEVGNKSILIIADYLTNPSIEPITTYLKNHQVKHITLICLINRI
jgi:hypothetical protein